MHAFSDAERNAFVRHINQVLHDDPDLAAILPIDPMTNDIFQFVRDGLLLWYVPVYSGYYLMGSICYCHLLLPLPLLLPLYALLAPPLTPSKLINAEVPDTIDPVAIHSDFDRNQIKSSKTFLVLENHRHCLVGAKKIGCNIINISGEDLVEGKPYLVFGLLWQIIRAGLLYHVNLREHPELMQLFEKGEVLLVCVVGIVEVLCVADRAPALRLSVCLSLSLSTSSCYYPYPTPPPPC